eukprot:47004-Alexandrium_andersonii.AAC.1
MCIRDRGHSSRQPPPFQARAPLDLAFGPLRGLGRGAPSPSCWTCSTREPCPRPPSPWACAPERRRGATC